MPCGFRLLAALGIWLAAAAAFAAEAGPSREETLTLQKRLTDAGCYHGAIDATPSAALDAAVKACPDQTPFLRIETGMHTAPIRRIGVEAACARIATASDDKTVRLWSLPDGKLQRTIRLPIGPGNGGKVDAVALSPDGRRLAAGGYDASYAKLGSVGLLLVDLDSGSIRRVGTFAGAIVSIAFSAEGARVALGLGGANGIRVYDWTSGSELFADRDYAADVYGLAFAPDGALIASSWDGQLRRYAPDLRLTAKRGGLAGQRPNGVAIDPAGRRLAVGFEDEPKVSIFDAATLAPIADADVGSVANGDFQSVAWSRDGGTFAAGGRAETQSNGVWRVFLREFDSSGRRRGPDIPVSANTVTDLRPCGDGFAFAAQDPAFGLASPAGAVETLQGPRTADMRDKRGNELEISGDGESVRFGLGYGEEKPVLFDLGAGSLADSPGAPAGLAPARVDGLPVTDWENSYEPKFKGVKIGLENYELSRSLAVRPDRSGFALGTWWSVRAFDAAGKPTWQQPGPGEAFGVDYSADGRILVLAYGDGTIRWLRGSDGVELLALFVDVPKREWVAWTPSGYYMASAGGEDLIGWHLNRGWTQEADFFPASQFRAQYNRPDIVHLMLTTLDEAEAVKQANAASQREGAPAKPTAFPPVVTILSPAEGAAVTGDTVRVDFGVRSPSGLPVDRLDVLVDGEPVPAIGFKPAQADAPSGHVIVEKPAVAKAKISLVAHAGALTSAPVGVDLRFSGASGDQVFDPSKDCDSNQAAPGSRPKLFALLVGVTGYEEADRLGDIQFAGRDAEGLADALKRQKGCMYADVQTRIVDMPQDGRANPDRAGPPNRLQVFYGLEWLKKNAHDQDLSIVYLGGHGWKTNPDEKFWFLTQEGDPDLLDGTAVSGDELLAFISGVKGKKILFLDACHAGAAITFTGAKAAAVENRPNMDQILAAFTQSTTGIVAYAAAPAQELAWEGPEFDNHGAFAKALIEAFGEGRGAVNRILKTDDLDRYLKARVPELTKLIGKVQEPESNKPKPVDDFPIAVVRL